MPRDFSLKPITSSVGTDGSFLSLSRPGCEFFCLPSSGAVVGMNGNVPFVLLICLHVVDRKNVLVPFL